MKVCIKEWIEREFGKKKPNEAWIRRKCREGKIPNATKIDRNWYIEIKEKNNEHKP